MKRLSQAFRSVCEFAQVRISALDLVRARLARWIAPQRKPAFTPGYRLPNPLDVDIARATCGSVKICRGPAKGCAVAVDGGCADCYHIHWHDTRPSAELLELMQRGDA